jgi:hypothetical protein
VDTFSAMEKSKGECGMRTRSSWDIICCKKRSGRLNCANEECNEASLRCVWMRVGDQIQSEAEWGAPRECERLCERESELSAMGDVVHG